MNLAKFDDRFMNLDLLVEIKDEVRDEVTKASSAFEPDRVEQINKVKLYFVGREHPIVLDRERADAFRRWFGKKYPNQGFGNQPQTGSRPDFLDAFPKPDPDMDRLDEMIEREGRA